MSKQGRVIIPAFSLGRTQQLVYFLNALESEGRLPRIPVYVDSPLASRLTNVYRYYQTEMNSDANRLLAQDENSDLFSFEGLTFTQSQEESIALNKLRGPVVIISASGMCENGRIRHHLKNSIEDPDNTIVIIGFQAQHTLGRRLVERQPRVRIFDRDYQVRARIEILNGLSAHADANDFEWWFQHLADRGGAGRVFLVHGEEHSARALIELIRHAADEEPVIPQRFESFEL